MKQKLRGFFAQILAVSQFSALSYRGQGGNESEAIIFKKTRIIRTVYCTGTRDAVPDGADP